MAVGIAGTVVLTGSSFSLQAELALRSDETPVGCVFVRDGKVIARGMNGTNATLNVSCASRFSCVAGWPRPFPGQVAPSCVAVLLWMDLHFYGSLDIICLYHSRWMQANITQREPAMPNSSPSAKSSRNIHSRSCPRPTFTSRLNHASCVPLPFVSTASAPSTLAV